MGFNLPGSPLPGYKSPEECQLECQKTSNCVGFTWVGDTKDCHLKEKLPCPSDNAQIGCVSGPKFCGTYSIFYF